MKKCEQNYTLMKWLVVSNIDFRVICGLYYKHTTIVNDASRDIRIIIICDATT
jgi:hypothetical protein